MHFLKGRCRCKETMYSQSDKNDVYVKTTVRKGKSSYCSLKVDQYNEVSSALDVKRTGQCKDAVRTDDESRFVSVKRRLGKRRSTKVERCVLFE